MSAQAITTQEVAKAAAELNKMRAALAGWLRFRTLNDQVLAGTARVRKPLGYAQRTVAQSRSAAVEQDLADKLAALLAALMPGQALPNADVTANPQAAVQLAQLALAGPSALGPVATGGLGSVVSSPWFWPAMIVAGVLLTITSAIQSSADVAKDREEKACIEAGACTDYGFWLKAGGVIAISWFAWRELGLGDVIKSYVSSKRRS